MRRGGVAQVTACAGGGVRRGRCAPERKVTPGMAGGRQRSRVCTVILAMVAGSDLSGHLVRVRAVGSVSGRLRTVGKKPARTSDNQAGAPEAEAAFGDRAGLWPPQASANPPWPRCHGALALSSRQGLRTRRRARSSRA
eukprot:scaffold125327_cov30-Phaeocystis_antarctica.AAC.1